MPRRTHRRRGKGAGASHRPAPGSAPGTLVIDPAAPAPQIQLIAYGPENILERSIANPEELRDLLAQWPVCWVNVDGLGDVKVIEQLGKIFQLHPLALEDIVHVPQRAKVELYGDQTFVVTHMLELGEQVRTEQLSLFFGKNFVLTFQERPGGDCLGPVRDRLRKRDSRLRSGKADYLTYALMDAVIDNYFPVLERYGEILEDLEDTIVLKPQTTKIHEIHSVKRELLLVRRAIWPLREAINSLLRDDIPYLAPETRIYLRDCYDHAVRIIDLVETYRELCSDLMDLYLSSLSNRMNEIMKVLTMISTLFIPLSFIASVYGMNFHGGDKAPWNMPELDWYFGYPLCLALMAAISIGQIFFFKKKGWILSGKQTPEAEAEEARQKMGKQEMTP